MIHTCRICLNRKAIINIFEEQHSGLISIKIMSLSKVQIHPEDGLPNSICAKCAKQLEICLKFKQQCEYTDRQLRLLIENSPKCDASDINSDSQEASALVINECTLISNNSDREEDNINIETNRLVNHNINKTQIVTKETEDKEHYSLLQYINSKEDKSLSSNTNNISINDNIHKFNIKPRKTKKEQCFTCGKVMSSRFRLKTHLQTHTGEKPFSCTYCNKNFSSTQNLKVHLRIHTGEKPLQCKICGNSFAHSAGLAAHTRKHTGETPYCCNLCPRSFRTPGHLQYHIRRHTGEKNFECDICSRAFITRSDLKRHSVTHTGERKHVCCVCGLRLAQVSHLKRHLTTHKRNKTLSCDQCGVKFSQKQQIEKHKKDHCDKSTKNVDIT